MKAVIVNKDMEPITIVELTPQMVRIVRENHGDLTLVCMDAPRHEPLTALDFRVRTVRLRPLVQQLTILQTHDEVDALTLQATFLAGQQQAVNEVFRKGEGSGAVKMLYALGPLIQGQGED